MLTHMKRLCVLTVAVLALSMFGGLSAAGARPVHATSAGTVNAASVPSSAVQSAAHPSGYHTHGTSIAKYGAWYNPSVYSNAYVHVDRILWPDSYVCAPLGQETWLGWAQGRVGDVRGAYVQYWGCLTGPR